MFHAKKGNFLENTAMIDVAFVFVRFAKKKKKNETFCVGFLISFEEKRRFFVPSSSKWNHLMNMPFNFIHHEL